MIVITEKSKCTGCHSCSNTCPAYCIQMVFDKEGFWYPRVDKDKCISCGLCERACPVTHKWTPDTFRTTKAMAAINSDEEVRLKSSSGGIFTLIAEEILKQSGVVFGAAFTDDFKAVRHIRVEDAANLEKLRGSKYVQSKIGNTYRQAKEYLDSGRKVLFTGTPCQIGGLYSYLGKPYDNLFTQDLICHGVPSPMVWEKYVDEREGRAGSKTRQMSFRYKRYGWKAFSVLFDFSNDTIYLKSRHEDPFMKVFLRNLCLRPSCYQCSFKGIQRQADITLADFWGIQHVLPDMDDDNGTSLVLIHSEKGQQLLDSLTDKIIYKEVDCDVVEKYNPSGVRSNPPSNKRGRFIREIAANDFEKTAAKYTKPSLYKRGRRFIIRIKRKITG